MDDKCIDFSDAGKRILSEGATKDLELFFVVAWSIWYNRNQKCFEDKTHPPNQIWYHARRLVLEHKEAIASIKGKHTPEDPKWIAPPLDFHKINVDGASLDDGRMSSVGVIIRNSKGDAVAAVSKTLLGQYTSLEIEFIALENGVLLAKKLELSQVIFKSNSLATIQSLQTLDFEGDLGHLCQGIINLMGSFRSWKFKHLKRDYNKVAHEPAPHNGCCQVWKGVSPPMVQHLIQRECI